MSLLAALFIAADAVVAAPVCYASAVEPGDQPVVIAEQETTDLSSSQKLKRVVCPENLVWSADAARRLCAFMLHYDAEQQYYFADLYGVAPIDVCNHGRLAAGLKALPADFQN